MIAAVTEMNCAAVPTVWARPALFDHHQGVPPEDARQLALNLSVVEGRVVGDLDVTCTSDRVGFLCLSMPRLWTVHPAAACPRSRGLAGQPVGGCAPAMAAGLNARTGAGSPGPIGPGGVNR